MHRTSAQSRWQKCAQARINLVALVIYDTLALDGAVSNEEGLRLGGTLVEEQVALLEIDAVHVLGHLCDPTPNFAQA